jgi:exonuclease III
MSGESFSVVSWNCNNAAASSRLWDYFLELDPDVAMLQEVGGLPAAVPERYACELQTAIGWTDGSPIKRFTALLVRGRMGESFSLGGFSGWIDAELDRYAGDLICRELQLDAGPAVKVISVYSPAHQIPRSRLEGIDITDVKLPDNPDIWLADILRACLRQQQPLPDEPWIVAGDFNLCETLDAKRPWAGNRVYLERMASLGLIECLRAGQGRLAPTYRSPRGLIKSQLDYVWVTECLADRLLYCTTGSRLRVFPGPPNLSDHLPVIARYRR